MKSLLAASASAILYGLLFPPFGLTALSWVALLPLFLALRDRTPLQAAALGGAFGFGTTALIILWLVPTLNGQFERPLAWSLLLLGFVSATAMAPYTALALAAWARGRGRVPAGLCPLLLAAAWVASELARTHLGIRSPWTKLGDAHFDSERLRQVAALAGVYGVSGIVALANAVLAEAIDLSWRRRRGLVWDVRTLHRSSLVLCALVAGALLYGEMRRTPRPERASGLDVVVVQGNLPPELRWKRASASRVLRRYAGLTQQALARLRDRPPDLVVWPENAVQTTLEDPVYGSSLQQLPQGDVAYLVGAPRVEVGEGGRRHFNSALLLREGAAPEHYDKRRLLLFSETRPLGPLASFGQRGDLEAGQYSAGRTPGLFRVADETLGVLICMEALYPALAREAARGGASVLVNLSNDGWYRGRGGAEQHFAQAVFRALETGLPLIRSTTTGVSAVVTPEGEVLARLGERRGGSLRVDTPAPRRGSTLYVRLGDWLALGCVLACLVAALGYGAPPGSSRPTRDWGSACAESETAGA